MNSVRKPDFNHVYTLVLLVVVVWVARCLHTDEFGFYEDDFWRVPRAMEWSWDRLWEELSRIFGGWGRFQGRPLHFALIQLLAWAGEKIGGLQGAYWIGYAIVAANSLLFYGVLRRVIGREMIVVPCALAYALYPADTTQAYLTHSLGAQPALTFLLAAALLYHSRWRPAAYVVSLGAMLSYETVFPVFLAVPLLEKTWNRSHWRSLAIHVAVVAAMMGAAGFLRAVAGEGRMALVDFSDAIRRTLYHLFIGPVTSLSSYFAQPGEILGSFTGEMQVFFVLALIAFLVRLAVLRAPTGAAPTKSAGAKGKRRKQAPRTAPSDDDGFGWDAGRAAAAGAVMIVISYLLAFTLDATVTHGRATRVHLAAVPGAALLIGALMGTVLHFAHKLRAGPAGVALVSLFFAALVPAALAVQYDYVRCWRNQRLTWTEIVRQTPDIEPGMVIFAEKIPERETREMEYWSWAVPLVYSQLYEFPEDFEPVPAVFGLGQNWRAMLRITKDFRGLAMGGADARVHRDSEVVLFVAGNGRLKRASGPVVVGGISYPLKEPGADGARSLPTRLLYRHLILPDGEGAN